MSLDTDADERVKRKIDKFRTDGHNLHVAKPSVDGVNAISAVRACLFCKLGEPFYAEATVLCSTCGGIGRSVDRSIVEKDGVEWRCKVTGTTTDGCAGVFISANSSTDKGALKRATAALCFLDAVDVRLTSE